MGRAFRGLQGTAACGSFPNRMALRPLPALALLGLTAAGLVAQTESVGDKEGSKRGRVVSEGVAAALAAGMPKYNPPPKPTEPRNEEDLPDLREIDKPRNQIIRLPDYVVREKRPPVFRERDINTAKGLAALAKKRYFAETAQALNRFTIPLFGMGQEAYASMMLAEQERLDNMASLKSTAADLKALSEGQGDTVRREVDRAYIRTDDFGYRKQR